MIRVAFFDAKPYDRESFNNASAGRGIDFHFFDFHLSTDTAPVAEGSRAVCAFVNDELDAACIRRLSEVGVGHIALRCAGYNNVDLTAAADFGVTVTRVPAYSPHAVAEYAVALLLSLNRKIHRAADRIREHNFSLNGLVGFDVYKKIIGIIGGGKIGKVAAQIFRGFGAEVFVFDPEKDPLWAQRYGISYVTLDRLLCESDIISLHVPLTPETYHLIDRGSLGHMKKGIFLVNTGRGKLVDTTALIEALKSGHLGGVALDVYEEEEGIFFEDLSGEILQDDELARLIALPNVLLTSHQGFLTKEALEGIAAVTLHNLECIIHDTPFLEGTELAANEAFDA